MGHPTHAAVTTLLVSAALAFATMARAEKALGTMEGMTVSLPDDFVCGESVRIGLATSDPTLFTDAALMGRIAGQLAGLMSFECPAAQNVMMEGRAGDAVVYQGLATARAQWSVMTMQAPESGTTSPPPVLPNSAQDSAAVAEPPTTGGLLPNLPDPGAAPADGQQATGASSPPESEAATEAFGAFRDITRDVKTGSIDTSGYNFPGLIAHLHLGEIDQIPDDQKTRELVASLITVVNTNCGERSMEVGLATMNYASPHMREMQRNPQRALERQLESVADILTQMQGGNLLGGMQAMSDEYAIKVQEAIDDGTLFISRNGCSGQGFQKYIRSLERVIVTRSGHDPVPYDEIEFSRLMSTALRTERGLADPAEALGARRLTQAQDTFLGACETQYGRTGFCMCLRDGLTAAGVGADDWAGITDMQALVALGGRNPAIRDTVRQCNQ